MNIDDAQRASRILLSGLCSRGRFIFLAHHAGGFDMKDIEHQMRAAFISMRIP
jgi:hypothetical protein